jgi:hypothetical protein
VQVPEVLIIISTSVLHEIVRRLSNRVCKFTRDLLIWSCIDYIHPSLLLTGCTILQQSNSKFVPHLAVVGCYFII